MEVKACMIIQIGNEEISRMDKVLELLRSTVLWTNQQMNTNLWNNIMKVSEGGFG